MPHFNVHLQVVVLFGYNCYDIIILRYIELIMTDIGFIIPQKLKISTNRYK